MDIHTKYDVLQVVYFLDENSVHRGRVENIKIGAYTGGVITIEYTVSKENQNKRKVLKENILWATKELLLSSL